MRSNRYGFIYQSYGLANDIDYYHCETYEVECKPASAGDRTMSDVAQLQMSADAALLLT